MKLRVLSVAILVSIVVCVVAGSSGEGETGQLLCRLHSRRLPFHSAKKVKSHNRIRNDKKNSNNSHWNISVECFGAGINKKHQKEFVCNGGFDRLKLVFVKGTKMSSSFVELKQNLISFNRFNGLRADGLVLKETSGSCELMMESVFLLQVVFKMLLFFLVF